MSAIRHLILIEHDHKKIFPATLALIVAAQKITASIDLLLMGRNIQDIAQQAAKIAGIDSVISCDAPQYEYFLAEECAPVIVAMMADYSHFWCAGTSAGKNIAPRVAGLLGIGQVSNVVAVHGERSYTRAIYAGSVLVQIETPEQKQILTIVTTAFPVLASAAQSAIETSVKIIAKPPAALQNLSRFLHNKTTTSDRPELTAARIVVSGGRGLGSTENFALIESLAQVLGAAVGASRAAVDAGFVANDCQVGQTGKIIAPELYIAIGISGAIQHLAGMKDSKTIVAINKDPDAPIMQIADYAIVGDLFEIVPQLISLLKNKSA